ncbi:MAG: hypothetical protein DWQ44_11410 [Bacteroidetes bacterium]|nr:MAG: hypothetical protein DWQ33_09530 [Bacteroidota bacterium]REK05229.1 MAG: hypothetical protein DWQ39_08540 [Bacteroidota bacterium]REK32634.1 MAG: hypothetical protein DWQ44_11410 [Bacteroidota bacterium]REK48919.1 MAG: hypothetical protein DWQ48_08550 [Bacteroidota bacterium]
MKSSKIVVAGLVGGIMFFFLGWLFYGILLMDFMMASTGSASGVQKEMPDFIPLIAGNLTWGIFYSVIFGQFANIRNASDGAKLGAIMGFFISLSYDLIMYGTTNIMMFNMLVTDVIVTIIMSTITGAVIGKLLGRKPEHIIKD